MRDDEDEDAAIRLRWTRYSPSKDPAGPGPPDDPAPRRKSYRVGTSREAAMAAAGRLATARARRQHVASLEHAIALAVDVVGRQASTVAAGGIRVTHVSAEKRWIDPREPFLLVTVTVTPPGPGGWAEDDLEAVRSEVARMAGAVPGGPSDVMVFIDKGASTQRNSSRRRPAGS